MSQKECACVCETHKPVKLSTFAISQNSFWNRTDQTKFSNIINVIGSRYQGHCKINCCLLTRSYDVHLNTQSIGPTFVWQSSWRNHVWCHSLQPFTCQLTACLYLSLASKMVIKMVKYEYGTGVFHLKGYLPLWIFLLKISYWIFFLYLFEKKS